MAAQRHKISLRVLKNISRVSVPFELFCDEFKVTKMLHRRFVFACLHFRMSQKICISYWNQKVCRKATTIRLFSNFENLMSNGIQVLSEFFWRTKFFPTSWSAVFRQVWRRSIFKFCVYKLAEAVIYLKFKWEFVIIGRGCLVLLKVKSSLCWRMLCLLKFLVLVRHACW